jgi:hypothetical protein
MSAIDYFSSLEAQTLNQFSSMNFGKSYASNGGSRMSTTSMNDERSEDDSASMTSERSVDEEDPNAGGVE